MTETPSSKSEQMQALRAEAVGVEGAHSGFVFGEGSPEASLMIVGEAPGAEEAAAGRPFVGPAGQLVNQLLNDVGLDRRTVWITNIAKHRPTRQEGKRLANRPPRVGEVKADAHWLEGELAIIRPKVILCLGNLAASTLIHKNFKMNEEHGRWFPGPYGSQATATFHPAYALRQIGGDRERVEAEMRGDFSKAKEALQASKRKEPG